MGEALCVMPKRCVQNVVKLVSYGVRHSRARRGALKPVSCAARQQASREWRYRTAVRLRLRVSGWQHGGLRADACARRVGALRVVLHAARAGRRAQTSRCAFASALPLARFDVWNARRLAGRSRAPRTPQCARSCWS